MNLAAPAALAFAATLPVIVLLWLLRRRRQEREVSSTYLWRQVLRDVRANAPWQRLRTHLLLILQLLAAALLTLALARPHLLGLPGERAHLVVLLDASGSMQTRTRLPDGPSRFEQARAEARRQVEALAGRDRVTLILVERVPRVRIAGGAKEAVLRALVEAAPTHATADWAAALSLAASIGRGEPRARALVLTDAAVDQGTLARLGISASAARYAEPVPNLSVRLALRPGGTERAPSALARVVNHGQEQAEARVEFYADGERIDRRQVDVPPGGAAELVWRDLPRAASSFEARMAAADGLAADDRAWAVLPRADRVSVLLVSRGNLFLERALRLREDVQLVHATPQNYAPGEHQLYVFDGWLPDPLPRGALLAVNPPPGNPLIEAAEPVGVGEVRPSSGPGAAPHLAHVSLEDVHVARSRTLGVPAWGTVVVESPESPLVVVGYQEGRPVGVIGFDLHESDLPLRVGFPVLMRNLLHHLVPPNPAPARAVASEPVPLSPDPVAQSVAVLTPDGGRVEVAPPFPVAPWTETGTPGIYTVAQELPQGERSSAFAVEFPEGESEPPGVVALPPAPAGAEASARSPLREIWPWVAALALLVLTAEWWVYVRGA